MALIAAVASGEQDGPTALEFARLRLVWKQLEACWFVAIWFSDEVSSEPRVYAEQGKVRASSSLSEMTWLLLAGSA